MPFKLYSLMQYSKNKKTMWTAWPSMVFGLRN